MKKLVPESIDESLQQVLKPPTKRSINHEIDNKAQEFGIYNPNKNVKLNDVEIIFEPGIETFKKELKGYGVTCELSNDTEEWSGMEIGQFNLKGKRKGLGVWGVEQYAIEVASVNDFLDGQIT